MPSESCSRWSLTGRHRGSDRVDRYDADAAATGPLRYLVPCIRGEILHYVRDQTWAMRVARAHKDLLPDLERAEVDLAQRLGRDPKPVELAAELGVSTSEVVEALGAVNAHHVASLDEVGPTGRPPAEELGEEEPALEVVEVRRELRRRIAELPQRERTALLLRFYGDHTQSQIAEQIGVSQMQVSRLLRRTLQDLRDQMCSIEGRGEQAHSER